MHGTTAVLLPRLGALVQNVMTVEDPTLFTATAQHTVTHTHTIYYGFRLLATQNGVDLTHIYRRLECKHKIILQDDHTVPII